MAKHPHAELIKQMVDDDTLRAVCQTYFMQECGLDMVVSNSACDWRLVPPKPKTITIVANGKEYVLPESMRVAPEVDMTYYLQLTTETASYSWKNDETDKKWLSDGICHATREAAQQWVDAMAEIRGAK